MRATAIATRQVRDLDANGTILHTEGKTPSGRVALSLVGRDEDEEQILSKLRRVFAIQTAGKAATEPLIGKGCFAPDGTGQGFRSDRHCLEPNDEQIDTPSSHRAAES